MRHHFGDFLDRGGDYWSVVPNRERYAYRIADVESGSADVHVMTIGRHDEDWQKVLTLPQLQHLALHGSYLATAEYAMIEECLPGVAGAEWGAFRAVALNWLDLPAEDPRMQLSVADLQEQHPEVRVVYDGRRQIEDPASRWFEFTGRGAGRVKCSSPQAAAKCGEREAAYLELRRQAAALLQ